MAPRSRWSPRAHARGRIAVLAAVLAALMLGTGLSDVLALEPTPAPSAADAATSTPGDLPPAGSPVPVEAASANATAPTPDPVPGSAGAAAAAAAAAMLSTLLKGETEAAGPPAPWYLSTELAEAPGPQPIGVPADMTSCDGSSMGVGWPVGERVAVPIGKTCPLAADWLGWDDPHGADAGQRAANLVLWVLYPERTQLVIPSWQDVLTGRSRARLGYLELVLNTYAGRTIGLPIVDERRGTGDRTKAHVVAIVPFQLERAFITAPDPACGGPDGGQTCLLGRFLSSGGPSPSPSGSASPSPSPTGSGSPSPSPSGSGSPSPSPSGSGSPSPSPSGSGSPSPSPSGSPSPSPSPRGSSSPSPSPSGSGSPSPRPSSSGSPPPPASWIRVSAPSALSLTQDGFLVRGTDNPAELDVTVESDGAWTMAVKDPRSGGFMLDDETGATLASPMRVNAWSAAERELSGSSATLTIGVASETVPVTLRQPVTAADPPGSYGVVLVFTVVSGL